MTYDNMLYYTMIQSNITTYTRLYYTYPRPALACPCRGTWRRRASGARAVRPEWTSGGGCNSFACLCNLFCLY